MKNQFNPYSAFHVWVGYSRMLMEAQAVVAFRTLGMMGLWGVSPGENARMIVEKQHAVSASMLAVGTSVMRGRKPDQVMADALRPFGSATSKNVRRLRKRGFRQSGR